MQGTRDCGEECAHSRDCHSKLFCCPNWDVCMDRTSFSTGGPSCGLATLERENEGQQGEPMPNYDDEGTENADGTMEPTPADEPMPV